MTAARLDDRALLDFLEWDDPAAASDRLATVLDPDGRSLARRDATLLRLHQERFGPDLVGMGDCPACGEVVEVRIPVADVLPDRDDERGLCIVHDGIEVEFRLPGRDDLVSVATSASSASGGAERPPRGRRVARPSRRRSRRRYWARWARRWPRRILPGRSWWSARAPPAAPARRRASTWPRSWRPASGLTRCGCLPRSMRWPAPMAGPRTKCSPFHAAGGGGISSWRRRDVPRGTPGPGSPRRRRARRGRSRLPPAGAAGPLRTRRPAGGHDDRGGAGAPRHGAFFDVQARTGRAPTRAPAAAGPRAAVRRARPRRRRRAATPTTRRRRGSGGPQVSPTRRPRSARSSSRRSATNTRSDPRPGRCSNATRGAARRRRPGLRRGAAPHRPGGRAARVARAPRAGHGRADPDSPGDPRCRPTPAGSSPTRDAPIDSTRPWEAPTGIRVSIGRLEVRAPAAPPPCPPARGGARGCPGRLLARAQSMSSPWAIAAVTETVVQLLQRIPTEEPTLGPLKVTFGPPDRARLGNNKSARQLNLYLYQVAPEHGLGEPGAARPRDGRRRPPAAGPRRRPAVPAHGLRGQRR